MIQLKHTFNEFAKVLTVIVALGGLLLPQSIIGNHVFLAGVIILLFGIPHGALDFIIFQRFSSATFTADPRLVFGFFYGLISGIYVLIWWIQPLLAFALFLMMSAYHFGQSNWHDVGFRTRTDRWITSILWGCSVIFVPVLLHWSEASIIIYEVTGHEITLKSMRSPIIFLLISLNLANFGRLSEQEVIHDRRFQKEVFNFFTLMALFFCTPLMIGFAIYFVFWHSLDSTIDQIRFLQQSDGSYTFQKYLLMAIPLTLVAFVLLGVAYYWLGAKMNQGLNVGVLFLFISVITVPHTILMDRLYQHDEIITNFHKPIQIKP